MTSQDKLIKIQQFKKSEIYQEFLEIGNSYYQISFKGAMNLENDDNVRVKYLEKMRGISLVLDIFNALEEEYEKDKRNEEISNAK